MKTKSTEVEQSVLSTNFGVTMMVCSNRKVEGVIHFANMMMKSATISSLVFFFIISNDGFAAHTTPKKINNRQAEKNVLDMMLKEDVYDSKVRPSGNNGTGPTVVTVNLFLRAINKIDDYEMEYSVELTFREQWLDDRLRWHNYTALFDPWLNYLTLTDSGRVWTPDIFFANEKQAHIHKLLMPNIYIRIFPDGHLLYSIRISLTLSCPMIFIRYPFDKQICSMKMASYSWTTYDLILKWKKWDPAQVSPTLHLPRFSLEQITTDQCDKVTFTGTYTCLIMHLLLQRKIQYFILQIYVPCWLLVILSYFSFWLHPSALAERISLGVTLLLTMVAHTSGFHQSKPPVSYTTALELWTNVCLSFVFGTLVEFALVQYVFRWEQSRKSGKRKITQTRKWEMNEVSSLEAAFDKPCECRSSGSGTSVAVGTNGKRWMRRCLSKFLSSPAKRIDTVFRIIYPLLFGAFNLAYWLEYSEGAIWN